MSGKCTLNGNVYVEAFILYVT